MATISLSQLELDWNYLLCWIEFTWLVNIHNSWWKCSLKWHWFELNWNYCNYLVILIIIVIGIIFYVFYGDVEVNSLDLSIFIINDEDINSNWIILIVIWLDLSLICLLWRCWSEFTWLVNIHRNDINFDWIILAIFIRINYCNYLIILIGIGLELSFMSFMAILKWIHLTCQYSLKWHKY